MILKLQISAGCIILGFMSSGDYLLALSLHPLDEGNDPELYAVDGPADAMHLQATLFTSNPNARTCSSPEMRIHLLSCKPRL